MREIAREIAELEDWHYLVPNVLPCEAAGEFADDVYCRSPCWQ